MGRALEDAPEVEEDEDEADESERPPRSRQGLEGRRSAFKARDKDMDQAPTA
jgi:hypothetical protein